MRIDKFTTRLQEALAESLGRIAKVEGAAGLPLVYSLPEAEFGTTGG